MFFNEKCVILTFRIELKLLYLESNMFLLSFKNLAYQYFFGNEKLHIQAGQNGCEKPVGVRVK